MPFPKDFAWGTATAAYQIEGAAFEDGRGLSVWDMLCRKPGAIWMGHTGAVACDHYHRYKEDVALMKQLGLKAYRFSISWPRVLPEGVGPVNNRGLEFYDRLVDALLEAGVQPWATLFHWDFPYELYCRGGWLNRDSADWFAEYAAVLADRLSDRVRHWMTLNEPNIFVGLGHSSGIHAPGDRLGDAEILRIIHHVLLAHGKAVATLRSHSKQKCQIGYAQCTSNFIPASDQPQDIDAARKMMFGFQPGPVSQLFHHNAWWDDPIFFGRYPEEGVKLCGNLMPAVCESDLKTIRQNLDFLGINLYSGQYVRAGADGKPEIVPPQPGHPLTAFYWFVTPEALRWTPRLMHERYQKPVVITENGMACCDWVAMDGGVHDPQRIDFLRRYLIELEKAGSDGVPLRGYFQWSLMDNFEWAEGFKQRFGIIYADYSTGRRVPKDSYYWYQKVIATNGGSLHAK